jgi:carbon monoxide dehydrogenase subunit G
MGAMMNRLGWTQNVGRTQATFGTRGDGSLYVPIIQKTQFDSVVSAAATVTNTIPLAQGIDTSDWVSAILSVRFHIKISVIAASTFKVAVQNIYLDPNEPDIVYVGAGGAAAEITSVTIMAADAAPNLYTASFSGPIGPMVRVVLTTTSTALGTNSIAISADLVGRTS